MLYLFLKVFNVVVPWFMTMYTIFAIEQLAKAIRVSGHYLRFRDVSSMCFPL